MSGQDQLEPGELVITLHYPAHGGGHGEIHIDRADPVIWVATELLHGLRRGHRHPDVDVTGDLITIRGSNRTVIYRVGKHDLRRLTYLCHWPD